MKVSRRQLTRHVAERLLDGAPRKQLIQELAAYLIAHKMVAQIDQIVADVARYAAGRGVVKAQVVSARPLSEELRKAVVEYVTRKEKATSVELEEHVEPSVLGGVVVETPTSRFDASIASQLKQLKVTE